MSIKDKILNKLEQVRLADKNFTLSDATWLWYYAHGYLEKQQYEKADENAEDAATDLWGNFWRPQEWPVTPNYPRKQTLFCPVEGVKHL